MSHIIDLDDPALFEAATPGVAFEPRKSKPWQEVTGAPPKDPAVSRRNRANRSRGTKDELAVAKLLGGQKVGQLNLPWDVVMPGYARIQAKKLGTWPSLAKVVEWLDAIPAGDELRIVALADTPGGGRRTRRLVVIDLIEFARWHGREERTP